MDIIKNENNETNKNNLIQTINLINKEKQNLENKINEQGNIINNINITLNQNINEINEKLDLMNEEKNSEINEINKETKIINQKIEELNESKKNIDKYLEELNNEKNNIISDINLIYEEKNIINDNLTNLENRIQQIEQSIIDNKKELKSSIEELRSENSNLKYRLDCMETEKNNKNKYYYNLFKGTKILTNDEKKAISKWIKPYHNLKFQLLYQATRDGFSEDKFHSKCDYKGPTVFIFVGENGRRFGGFTTIGWNKENKVYSDDNSFLFSLDFRTKFGVKKKGDRAIYCQAGSSVLFGPDYQNGDDFIVKNNIAYCRDNAIFFNFNKNEVIGSNSIYLKEFEVYEVYNYVS